MVESWIEVAEKVWEELKRGDRSVVVMLAVVISLGGEGRVTRDER